MARIINKSLIASFVAISILTLTGCENPLMKTLKKEIVDLKAAHISNEHIPAKYCIDRTSQVSFVFTEGMDVETVKYSGSIVEDSKSVHWKRTYYENDTIVFTPKTEWHEDPTLGRGCDELASLYISGYSIDGYKSKDIEWMPAIIDGVIYVDEQSSKNSTDTNYSVEGRGTKDNPLHSLAEAIATYNSFYAKQRSGEIRVRAGNYSCETLFGNNISIDSSLIIKGGYNPNNWDDQNPDKYITNINGYEGLKSISAISDDVATVVVGKGAKLYMEGISVYPSYSFDLQVSCGITGKAKSNIELQNCKIYSTGKFTTFSIETECDAVYTKGDLIVNNSKIILSAPEETEKSKGIYANGSDNIEITNTSFDFTSAKAESVLGIHIKKMVESAVIVLENNTIPEAYIKIE